MIPTLESNSYQFLQPETCGRHYQIRNKVFSFYSVPIELSQEMSRKRHLVVARQVSMHLIRKNCSDMSLKEIGDMFNQHHTTVINAVKCVQDQIKVDKRFKANLEYLERFI